MRSLDKEALAAMSPAQRAASKLLMRATNAADQRRERQLRSLNATITRRRAKIDREYQAAIFAAREAYRAAEDAARQN